MALARALAHLARPAAARRAAVGARCARARCACAHEIKALQRRLGVTTIMVTHDQEEALTMADRIVVMNQGAIEQVGTPQEIYRRPATRLRRRFRRHDELPRRHAGRRPDRVQVGGLDFACAAAGRARRRRATVRSCIRPEDVRVRDLPADVANRVAVEVAELDFLGSFCRATLQVAAAPRRRADGRLLDQPDARPRRRATASMLDVALPPDRLRVFARVSRGRRDGRAPRPARRPCRATTW